MTVTESRYDPVVIPDSSGTLVVLLYGDAQALEWTRYPVLAWVVTVSFASGGQPWTDPVIYETLSDQPWCYEIRVRDETHWLVPEDREFDTVTAVIPRA